MCKVSGLFIGTFRHGNKPPVLPGEENSFSMRLSEGKQIVESKHLNEKKILKEDLYPFAGGSACDAII